MNSFEDYNLFLPNLASLRLCGRNIRIRDSSITGKFAQAARYDKHVGLSFWIVVQSSKQARFGFGFSEGQVVATLKQGTKLFVQGDEKSWYFVPANGGKNGWISKSLTAH